MDGEGGFATAAPLILDPAPPGGILERPAGREAKAPFAALVLTCGKCARKLDGGFGTKGRKPLRSELKREAKRGGWREAVGKVRVADVGCLGLCPKRRQVVATAELLGRRRLLVVEPGEEAGRVLTRLFGPRPG